MGTTTVSAGGTAWGADGAGAGADITDGIATGADGATPKWSPNIVGKPTGYASSAIAPHDARRGTPRGAARLSRRGAMRNTT